MRQTLWNRRLLALTVTALALLGAGVDGHAAEQDEQDSPPAEPSTDLPEEIPTIEEKAQSWQRYDGFQPFYWDTKGGKIWLEISTWNQEFLFVHALSTGLGSNPVGLDRGQLGSEYVCRFERVGPKVLLIARNLNFRALSDDENQQRAVEESFAKSILWGGQVGAETDGTVLVDVTGLMLSDLQGVAARLKQTKQGEYSIDHQRSAVYLERCKAFPQNSELESTLTFSGKGETGPLVRRVSPAPLSISLRQHLSFVQLPDGDYSPRAHDPRCASMFVSFADYASPIDQPLQKRWIMRHRLQKRDPSAEPSEAVEPIVYYVDPGAPEPIRSALVEGASWWNEAFEAAGFRDAFQVRILPPDADPMDVRYNVIQWVHRRTRGWSYGGSVVDPRTGEIIKGHVTLGSLRVRQDRLLFDGLTPPHPTQNCNSCGLAGVAEDTTLALLDDLADPTAVALARIRQLSAHEVGHTLGFVHNFAASTYADRASVMDYPAPRVNITEDKRLDLSDAYGVGIGQWDQWAVQFAYRQFPDADESAELEKLVRQAIENKFLFISDADARPAGAAHPLANLWDNGNDPVAELNHVMRVRRLALLRLSEDNLGAGQPVSALGDLLVPIYLYHRYQVDAAAKMIGGSLYTYAVKGDGQVAMRRPTVNQQRQAVFALIATINPLELVIPDEFIDKLPPQPYSSHRDIERFRGQTAPIFDTLGAARVAADMTIGNLLQPQRISRLALPAESPFRAQELMVALVDAAWRQAAYQGQAAEISRVVRKSLNDHVIGLLDHPQVSTATRAIAHFGLDRIKQHVQLRQQSTDANERNFARLIVDEIKRFESRPHKTATEPEKIPPPPGSPIGQ